MGKRVIALGLGVLLVVAAVILVRTLAVGSRAEPVPPLDPREVEVRAAAERLAAGLRARTISYGTLKPVPGEAFRALHVQLAEAYPRVHASLERELVSDYSLLYRWPGRDEALRPALLMAHQDVVPVDGADWQHPPFGGEIADGAVWGRGAIDDKGSLYAILEAVELLLADGFVPERDLYLFFGHDEETGGARGAGPAAELLASRGVELCWVLDEGGFVVEGMLPGAEAPIALVGVAEKGSVTFELSVEAPGGHSSIPPRHSAIGILAEAITRLEARPMPGGVDRMTERLLLSVAPELPFPVRAAVSNLWLFGPLVEAVMAGSPPLDAMQRTTTAVTLVEGGIKPNVLPSRAQATVNFRIRPGDTADSVEQHVRETVDDDRVAIVRVPGHREASPVAPTDSAAFALLSRTVREVFPGVAVVPYTVVGGTDSRHFARLTPDVLRFLPFRFGPEATHLVHGTDEHLKLSQLGDAVRFYARLIERSGSSSDRPRWTRPRPRKPSRSSRIR